MKIDSSYGIYRFKPVDGESPAADVPQDSLMRAIEDFMAQYLDQNFEFAKLELVKEFDPDNNCDHTVVFTVVDPEAEGPWDLRYAVQRIEGL